MTIVRIENSMDEGIGNIEFYGGMWYVDGTPSNSLFDIIEYDGGELEVIGNIFDDKSLLEDESCTMYGFISGISDTDDINYCPKCGERIGTYKGYGTAVCDECGFRFGVVECEEDQTWEEN